MATEPIKAAPSFTTLLGVVQAGQPDKGEPFNATALRTTALSQDIVVGRHTQKGLITGNPPAAQTASFTVASNNFGTGRAVIRLGDYQIVAGVDYIPGAGVNATATAVAAAIDALPEFSAAAVVAAVNITYAGMGRVEFRAFHYGVVTNFTPLVPTTGYMTFGTPAIAAPTFT